VRGETNKEGEEGCRDCLSIWLFRR